MMIKNENRHKRIPIDWLNWSDGHFLCHPSPSNRPSLGFGSWSSKEQTSSDWRKMICSECRSVCPKWMENHLFVRCQIYNWMKHVHDVRSTIHGYTRIQMICWPSFRSYCTRARARNQGVGSVIYEFKVCALHRQFQSSEIPLVSRVALPKIESSIM